MVHLDSAVDIHESLILALLLVRVHVFPLTVQGGQL